MRVKTFCFSIATAASLMALSPLAHAAVPDQLKKDFAQAIYDGSPDLVHKRNPQPLLRAVIVLNVKLDENNQWRADVIRGNDQQPEMQARAIETVKKARMLDLSDTDRTEMQRGGLIEAWLFDSDGTFQVKTLAKAQQSGR